jgi:hypothetical protein
LPMEKKSYNYGWHFGLFSMTVSLPLADGRWLECLGNKEELLYTIEILMGKRWWSAADDYTIADSMRARARVCMCVCACSSPGFSLPTTPLSSSS